MSEQISEQSPGLFGWVPAPPRGQGRPAFTWSREKSNKIMILFAAGYTEKAVAPIIGCNVKTLRKVFTVECRERARADLVLRTGMMARLLADAEDGNVAASKALAGMIERERAVVINNSIGKPGPKAKAEVKGKKIIAAEAAEQVDGLYGTRQPPAQLMN